MYTDELTKLVDLSIVDGQLTDKERQVLMRRAQSQGIDADEFEVYLEGVLYQRREKLGIRAAPPADNDHAAGPLKCPSCREVVNGLNHVCPSCGLVIDADHDSHGNLEEMMEEQENLLLQAKAAARQLGPPPAGSGVSYLAIPLAIVVLGAVMYHSPWPVLGGCLWVAAFVVYRVLRRRQRPTDGPELAAARLQTRQQARQQLEQARDTFAKNERQIDLFFGADRKVTQVLDTLRREMAALAVEEPARASTTGLKWALRLAIVATVVGTWAPKIKEYYDDEKIMSQASDLLRAGRADEARALTAQLRLASNQEQLERQINAQAHLQMQTAAMNQRLDTLQSLILRRRFTAASQQLAQLQWLPDSTEEGQRARSSFLQRKAALNDQLPERYRLYHYAADEEPTDH